MLFSKLNVSARAMTGILVSILLTASPAHAKNVKCRSASVFVESSSRSDIANSCQAARNAINFLSTQGLRIPDAISIKVVSAMPEGFPKSALGAYTRAGKQIFVLSSAAFKRQQKIFNIAPDDALYRSVTSHEVAHAIAFHNFKDQPTLLGQEYIAFVTFFSTLPAAQREQILWHYDYDASWQLYAAILYLSDSLEFGAHAYWHFLKQENGSKYFQRILAGEVLTVGE